MTSEEEAPVIDVHPPHEPVHGWRDFAIHLSIITIGLLIALSLEGLVEWQHHRHLVHEAEASLHAEIKANADSVKHGLDNVHAQQKALENDVVVLKYIEKNHKAPKDGSMEITFHIGPLRNVSWQTAQSTGALSYMDYATAQEYADIYNTQSLLESAEQQAARDTIVSIGSLGSGDADAPDPTAGEAASIRQKIEVLHGQLLLVESLMKALDGGYGHFLAAHPN